MLLVGERQEAATAGAEPDATIGQIRLTSRKLQELELHTLGAGERGGTGPRPPVHIARRSGLVGGPHREQAVARELQNIAAGLVHGIDDSPEVHAHQCREALGAFTALGGVSLREAHRTGNIGKQNRRLEFLDTAGSGIPGFFARGGRRPGKTGQHPPRDVRCEFGDRGRHAIGPASPPGRGVAARVAVTVA